MGKKVEGYWDCSYCGAKANRGRYRNCPSCGRPRGASTKFYIIEKDNFVPDSQVPKGPDWFCECCDSYNTYSAKFCTSCGAPKGSSKDYFDIRKDVKRPDSSSYGTRDSVSKPKTEYTSSRTLHSDDTASERENSSKNDSYHSYTKPDYSSSKIESTNNNNRSVLSDIFSFLADNTPKILISLLVVVFVVGVVYLVLPKDVDLNVTSLTWKKEIRIEEYRTVRESDWYVPAGGRVAYTNEEVKYYEPIYEKQAVQKSETYISGYRTETEYIDLGNGYFDTRTYQEPIYDTRYYTEYEDVVVGDRPIYATKYYYDIERWVYARTAISFGERNSPYMIEKASSGERDSSVPFWPDTNLKSNERESGRFEYYYVQGYNVNDKKQEIKQYNISYDLWNRITTQSTIKVVVQLGRVKEIKE